MNHRVRMAVTIVSDVFETSSGSFRASEIRRRVTGTDGIGGVENPACGDRLQLTLRIEAEHIVEVRFKAKGCVPSMACASRLAEMMNGMRVRDAQALTREDLVNSLGGLPEASTHAGFLAMDALAEALRR